MDLKKLNQKLGIFLLSCMLVLSAVFPIFQVSAALSGSDVTEEELALTNLTLMQAVTTTPSVWSVVPGNLLEGYVLFLDVSEEYYLDVDNLEINGTLQDGYFGFTLDPSSVAAGFYTYWLNRGVFEGCTGTWQPMMWQIINGDLPFFYLKVSDSGTVFKLVDGLKYILFPGADEPLFIEGTYWLGEAEFNGTLLDTLDRTDDVTVDITFNDQPLTQAATRSTPEDTPVSITLTASDTFPGTLTWETSEPAHGSLTGEEDSITYTPDQDWFGEDSFTYTIDDGYLGTSTSTITITVSPVNDPPVAHEGTINTTVNTPVAIILDAEDVEGDSLSWFRDDPSHGTISGVMPNLLYTPDTDYQGPDSFEFYVHDGQEQSEQVTVSIQVYDALAISAIDLQQSQDEIDWQGIDGDLASGYAMLLDAEVEYYHLDVVEITSNRAVAEGMYPFYFDVTGLPEGFYDYWENERGVFEGCAGTYEPIMWEIISGEAPIFYLDVTAVDMMLVDGLIYQLMGGAKAYLRINGDYWPGEYTFVGTVADNLGFTADLEIGFTFDDLPVAEPQALAVDEDTALAIILSGTDHYGGSLTFAVAEGPAHGSLAGTPPNLTYTPGKDFNGADSFTFTANDGGHDSHAAEISITVNPVNDKPVGDFQSVSTDEDEDVAVVLTGFDVEGDSLTFDIATPPSHGSLSGSPPNLTYTPNANYYGSDSFTFTANDGSLSSDPATVSITIDPVEDVPVAFSQSVLMEVNASIDITLEGFDGDGDPLTYQVTQFPTHGSLVIGGGDQNIVTYRPAEDYAGNDHFEFAVSDGKYTSSSAAVEILVVNNSPPVAYPQELETDEDTQLEITLTGYDPDGDTLRWRIMDQPSHGSLVTNPILPDVIYVPDPNYYGTDYFTFRVSDGLKGSNLARVDITIAPINDAPVAHGQTVEIALNKTLRITLKGTDVDGDVLTYQLVSLPDFGSLVFDAKADNVVIYTPNVKQASADSFIFRVSDGVLSDKAVVRIVVSGEYFETFLPLVNK